MKSKRIADLLMAMIFTILLILPIIIIAFAVKLTSSGSVLFWSDRVGLNNKIFKMPKFRTMNLDCPIVASELLLSPNDYLTPIGSVLRRYSLDEIPQLWCIFNGNMSFVGPRPALYNQHDLIALRVEKGIEKLLPGLTGLAQINGRDNLTIDEKVYYDYQYMMNNSLSIDFKILFSTVGIVVKNSGVRF